MLLGALSGEDPGVKDRNDREASMWDIARHRYNNVAQDGGIRTVKHKIPGKDKGTGAGGAASGKS